MREKTKAILYILLAGVGFSFMNVFVRLSGDLPTIEKAFFRNLVAAFIALVVLIRSDLGLHYEKRHIPMLFMRSICGTLGIMCNFYAVDHMNIADASILNKLSPFAAVIFSIFLLKEKASLKQYAALIGVFIGALFVIKPSLNFADFAPGLIGFTGGMGAGAAYAAVRYLSNHGAKNPQIVFFFSAFSTLVMLPFVIAFYKPMSFFQLFCLLMAGASAAVGQFSITAASHAPAKEISIFDYSQIITSAILGFIFFSQIPDALSLIGYAVIIGISYLNWRAGLKADTAGK
jgi:drug/metabolite transporter (DMT)-like permease